MPDPVGSLVDLSQRHGADRDVRLPGGERLQRLPDRGAHRLVGLEQARVIQHGQALGVEGGIARARGRPGGRCAEDDQPAVRLQCLDGRAGATAEPLEDDGGPQIAHGAGQTAGVGGDYLVTAALRNMQEV